MSKILEAGQDYVEGHIVETLHKIDDKLDSAESAANNAQTTAYAAQTTANNALPKTGSNLVISSSGQFTVVSPITVYTGAMITTTSSARDTTTPGFGGLYQPSSQQVNIYRNNASGIEQKIILPLSTFGTSKMSVTNAPSAGTLTGLVPMGVKSLDTGNEYNTTTNRWTATIAGTYELNASVLKAASTETKVYFRKNGAAFGVGGTKPITTNPEIINVTTEIVSLQAGDYIDVFVTSGQIITDFPTSSFKVTTII